MSTGVCGGTFLYPFYPSPGLGPSFSLSIFFFLISISWVPILWGGGYLKRARIKTRHLTWLPGSLEFIGGESQVYEQSQNVLTSSQKRDGAGPGGGGDVVRAEGGWKKGLVRLKVNKLFSQSLQQLTEHCSTRRRPLRDPALTEDYRTLQRPRKAGSKVPARHVLSTWTQAPRVSPPYPGFLSRSPYPGLLIILLRSFLSSDLPDPCYPHLCSFLPPPRSAFSDPLLSPFNNAH